MINLDAYLARLGAPAPAGATLEALVGLHLAHALAIPFENLDIQLGRPISLELPVLEAKLVRGRRGGYCFEQNTLFRAALEALGFAVEAFEARVRVGTDQLLPRTHMLLQVRVEGREWLCDVGFGGGGPLCPVPMDGEPATAGRWTFRVRPEGPLRVLQSLVGETWMDLYAFLPEPRPDVDFQMGNWYTSTYPGSRFLLTLTAQRTTREARYILRNLKLEVDQAGGWEVRDLCREEVPEVLDRVFGLQIPVDARFRALDPADPGHRDVIGIKG
ncbi:MAG TPA: arylamine N-acetyltransferase [Holophagaceae bacterium]|nr:arylamine N-acetyltransferase [Holophagaceae bacterium]